ncbi:TrbI/VirB10 family protein [Caulobacter sp. KR2-114]|jgi:type IV secretion system protein VirB10|uniref:TrbI/VirB10 family protein n=1 Tax=Caulobacter sp. KR2-114 TaxID=3400912 RepID=UPI003C0C670B
MTPDQDSEKAIAAELRLRGDPPRVTRLSRRALMVLGTGAVAAVAGAITFAMRDHPERGPRAELFGTNAKPPADALAALPKDYARLPKDTPRLGPPLPGDLGRPILAAQGAGPGGPPAMAGSAAGAPPSPDPASQQRDQERQAARTSRLFAASDPGGGSQGEGAASPALALPPPGPTSAPAAPDRKQAFLAAPADLQTASSHRLDAPVSPYVLQAGAVIPAALMTGIRSDLPGQVTAQVTENVYDSPTGRILLIPQGAKLVGLYDSQVEFGQSRLLLAWTRLILPDGRSIVLDRQPAGNAQGFAGLQDQVDRHWKQLASAAVLSTLLGVGAELGAGSDDSDVVRALRQGAANSVNQVGQQVVGKSLDIQPTLTVRPGFPVRVIITRDLVLEPSRN